MNIINSILFLFVSTISYITYPASAQHSQDAPLFINCGISNSATSLDNRVWRSDNNPAFAPPNLNTISSTITSATDDDVPYKTARVFHSSVTYTFSLTPGPKFIRVHFSTSSTTKNNISPDTSFLSLQANDHVLLQNFNPFLNSPPSNNELMYEFHVTVDNVTKHNLALIFTPGDFNNDTSNSNTSTLYGYVNGIEIVHVPQDLYVTDSQTDSKPLQYITNPQLGYTFMKTSAFQMMYRLNVGGPSVGTKDDSGNMSRTWYNDQNYVVGFLGAEGGLQFGTQPKVYYTKIPSYVAPALVYATERIMGNNTPVFNMRNNLTWRFDVDPGFDYLVRLHLCEMNINITRSQMRLFNVYIDERTAEEDLDVWTFAGGLSVASYKDYVIYVDGASNGIKVPFYLALKADNGTFIADVLLNGLEILKLSPPSGNLAVPNPPSTPGASENPTPSSSSHKSLAIILGIICGATLLALVIALGCFILFRRRAKNKKLASKSSSKAQWLPIGVDSDSGVTTNPSSGPSLPSDLCRRFSLGQIRVATCDFDEYAIIGTGGFGKVYKGSIDDGVTTVAIKRLNPASKQGFNEFRTEIEMLTRLRHVHLVSLIGYCDDQGEMILVYDYMSRGTLREHLAYKENDKNEKPLPWKQRLMICIGSARGIHYLHAGAVQSIIHRDVKSTNILLDDNWTAKVSDFGLSKVGPASETGVNHVSTAVKGTYGYLDPEYYRRLQLTEKSDVYSFGVVLFEVLCGRPALNPSLPKKQVNLASWAQSRYKNGTLHTIVDPNLRGQIAPECLRIYGEIAEKCVRDHWDERPSMGDVVWALDFALQLQQTAETSNIGGGPFDSVPNSEIDANGGDGGTTDDDMFTNTTGENLSQISLVRPHATSNTGSNGDISSVTGTSN